MSGRIVNKDFVIEGWKTPIWSKPGNLTNTELTITPRKKPTEDPNASTRGRRHAQRPVATSMLTNVGGILSSSLGNFGLLDTHKSVTFDSTALGEGLSSTELDRNYGDDTIASCKLNDSGVASLNGMVHTSSDKIPWFTRYNHHLSGGSQDGIIGGAPLGTLGVALSSMVNMDNEMKSDAHATLASLSKEFFPLTLSASTFGKTIESPMQTNLTAPSATSRGLPHSGSVPWKPKRSKSPKRKGKISKHDANGGGASTPNGLASQSLEKMYLRTVEAPVTATAPGAMAVTPFQAELARLRMERLRLEEKHLLEIKRQEELERIRGPQPKWYELKSPEFHYEAHKNTELLRNEAEWQALLDYRTKLLNTNKDFQRMHTVY